MSFGSNVQPRKFGRSDRRREPWTCPCGEVFPPYRPICDCGEAKRDDKEADSGADSAS